MTVNFTDFILILEKKIIIDTNKITSIAYLKNNVKFKTNKKSILSQMRNKNSFHTNTNLYYLSQKQKKEDQIDYIKIKKSTIKQRLFKIYPI
jgi:hypothetical protein